MNTALALCPVNDISPTLYQLETSPSEDPTVLEFLDNGTVALRQVSEFGEACTIILSADMAQVVSSLIARRN